MNSSDVQVELSLRNYLCVISLIHITILLYLEIKLTVDSTFSGDGEVFTWGRGTHGQLGHGNLDSIPHPKFVKFLENHKVTCVSAGWNHSGFATGLTLKLFSSFSCSFEII